MFENLITSHENADAKENSLYGWIVFIICFLSGVFGGVTSTLMSVYLPMVVKDLLENTDKNYLEQVSAIINSIFIFGWMTGGLLWGFICDRTGRKKAVMYSTAFCGFFTLMTGFAPSWEMVLVSRFFAGFGVGGILVTTAILIAEVWNEKNKSIALGILSITIPVGIFSAGLIDYFISNWRQAFYVGLIPLVLALLSKWFIKESEAWIDMHKLRPRSDGLTASIFNKSLRKDLFLGCLIFGTMLIGLWAVFAWLPTWVHSLLVDSDGQKERGISMMLFATGGLTGGIISGWISNAIGMRKSMLICFAGCFILSFLLFKLNHTISILSYLEMAGIALFFGISQGVLNVYIPELFPTALRASATGFCFNIGRLFTGTVVFFVGSLVSFLGGYGNAIFIFSFVFLIGFVVTLFAHETKVNKS